MVPETSKNETILRIRKKLPIKSTLLDFVGKADNPHYKTLAFHVVSEIHQGAVKTKEGFREWFRKSLAHYQDQAFNDDVVDRTLDLLSLNRAIWLDKETKEYQCTGIGKVASMFYFSPFDVSDLKKNFDQLFDKGYDVLESKDGRETVLTANKELPDLILLDVMMPGMDGFEVLEKLRQNPLTDAIPVVMLTSMGASEGEQHAMKLGVQHYVSKPFDPETLQATVRVALREAGAKLDQGDEHENI